MVWARRMWLRLQTLFHRQRVDHELDDEIRFHLDQQIAENVAAGMSWDDASHAAARVFGNSTLLKEEAREAWGWVWLEQIAQDVRYGFRLLSKNCSFTTVAVSTLALGIAATAVLFSIFDTAYIHFGETEQANRQMLLTQQLRDKPPVARFSAPEYFDIAGQQHYHSFDGFFATRGTSATLSENLEHQENPERVKVVHVTSNMFSLYGISPILGRTFTTDEDRPGGPNVAVLTYWLWDARFGGDPSVTGKTIKLDDVPYTVIGVMPRRSRHWGADIYVPLGLDAASNNRSTRELSVAGVTKEGFSAEQTRPELAFLAHRVEAEYGATHPEYKGLVYEPIDVRKGVVGDLRIALYILMGAVAMLALITTANIAGLLVARTLARAGEIGTRLALGAMPSRLARQFLTEGVLLSLIAGGVGVALGALALKPVLALTPGRYIGDEAEVHASPAALLASLSLALLLGVLFGLAPAFLISRRGVVTNLQQGRTRSVTEQRGGRIRAALVLLEMALAFVVIMSAGLMVRTYRQITSMDLGFRPDHVLTMMLTLPESKYPGATELANFSRELLTRVRSLPGVSEVCASSNRPAGAGLTFHDFSIPGRPLNRADGIATAAYRTITPAYFRVIGTALREGRFFTEQDLSSSSAVAMVNESFARTYFPNEDAIGKQVRLENPNGSFSSSSSNNVLQIVGIVKDARQIAFWQEMSDLYKPITPELYVPLWQHPEAVREVAILLRTGVDPANLTSGVRREVLVIDPERPVYSIETLQGLADNALGPTRLCLVILGTFAGIALLTACVGLYAIVSYSVTRRTNEIGIRMALGADQRDILRLVTSEGFPLIALGLVVGLLASLGLTRLISSLLYGVPPNDGATLIAVSAVLTATAMLAVYIPARRAMSVDPLVALRYE
jgi:predicted permease